MSHERAQHETSQHSASHQSTRTRRAMRRPAGRPRGHRRRAERVEDGQVTLLMGAAVVLALVVVAALGRLGATTVRAARVQAAADAAALAALQGGAADAHGVAADNGAEVVTLRLETGWAQVTVARDGTTATATAALVDDTGRP